MVLMQMGLVLMIAMMMEDCNDDCNDDGRCPLFVSGSVPIKKFQTITNLSAKCANNQIPDNFLSSMGG